MFKNLFKKREVTKAKDTYEKDVDEFTKDLLASNWRKIEQFQQAYKA